MLETLASSIFLTAMGLWLGGVVFFSFFTAPVIFERLPRSQATELISVIFPRYYMLGYVCGFLMLVAGAYPIYIEGSLAAWATWLIAGIATGVSLYAGRVVMPRVRRLRITAESSAGTPDHPANRERYNRAHHLSVTLNSVVLLLLIVEAIFYGWRVRYGFVG